MIIAGFVAFCYAIIGAAFWFFAAYRIGQHFGEAHDGSADPACEETECTRPGIAFVVGVIWPISSIMMIYFWLQGFWETAGANSKLPPENEHPTAKKQDIEFLP